ncbi:unnamed protein product [Calicophoron daubneyi]|uniref:Uncharacterized protein n=1 Tax=Calicophoron daubneyi TaxID=300641 RepID=A0AAV2SZS3_CALDB
MEPSTYLEARIDSIFTFFVVSHYPIIFCSKEHTTSGDYQNLGSSANQPMNPFPWFFYSAAFPLPSFFQLCCENSTSLTKVFSSSLIFSKACCYRWCPELLKCDITHDTWDHFTLRPSVVQPSHLNILAYSTALLIIASSK